MIVCHCHGVTDREIRACIRNGACTTDEIAAHCGASSGCGGCSELVDEIVHGERRRLAVLKSEAAPSPRSSVPALEFA